MNQLTPFRETRLPARSVGLQRLLSEWDEFDRWPEKAAPVVKSEEVKAEAERLLPKVRAALERADRGTMEKWLIALGNLVAGKTSVDEAKMKIGAYSTMLDYPDRCFTDKTLRDAARKFRWFPSYSEVCELLDEEVVGLRRLARNLRRTVESEVEKDTVQEPVEDRRAAIEELKVKSEFFRQAMAAPKRKRGVPLGPLTEAQKKIRRDIEARERARRSG